MDPYFSGSKLSWLLEAVYGARELADAEQLAFGTVDTFLLWRLTEGKVHATDVSNASRTMLFNLHTLEWDEDLLVLFGIPRGILPEVCPSRHDFGEASFRVLGSDAPIGGIAGDQQAATFGQACYRPGMVKNTYGTGSFLLMNTGSEARFSKHRLLTTAGWDCGSGVQFALEGSVFVTGAAIQWLRDELGIITQARQAEGLAQSVADSGGVYFVPAFAGLGAPYWDSGARGAILGLTRGTSRAHIVRAALEAACYQSRDVIEAMQADCGAPLTDLRVDGGMTANNTLLQMQADILGIPVHRPVVTETTALGAAYLAGLQSGMWKSTDELAAKWKIDRTFEPQISEDQRESLYTGWKRAVERTRESGD
jgi:glycerol kinase